MDRIDGIVDRIEQACQDTQQKEISTSEIGEKVMEELHRLDEVAYVRFASVYRQFKDAGDFFEELSAFLKQKERKGK